MASEASPQPAPAPVVIPGSMMIKKKDYTNPHDRKSLHSVRDNYGVLTDLMSQIGHKLSDVSNAQEKEFLNAYRVHMLNVQLELKELKSRVEKAEESLQDDGEVSKLEDECNWFRGETDRLLANRATMQKDIKRMRTRLESLADQQSYLRDQLKTVLKKTRIIEAEIEYNGGRSMMSGSNAEMLDLQVPQSPASAIETKLPAIKQKSTTKKNKKVVLKAKSSAIVMDSFVPQSTSPTQRGAVVTMRTLNAKLSSNKNINITPEEQLALLRESRTPYELELEGLIKQQFTEVIQRRSQTVASNSKSRLNVALNSSREGVQEISNIMTREIPKEIEGMTGLGVEHFTDTDRYNVMVDYLSNYPVFCAVVRKAVSYQENKF